MTPPRPYRAKFAGHGLDRCAAFGRSPADVGELVVANHHRRERNHRGRADWQLNVGGLVIVYDWPDHDDPTTARVVSLWPTR